MTWNHPLSPERLFAVPPSIKNLPIRISLGVLWLFSFAPLRMIHAVGVTVGEMAFRFYRSRRRITEINLRLCFPALSDKDIRHLARSHFHAIVTGFLLISWAWWAPAKRLAAISTFKNRAILDDSLAKGENIILLVPHFCCLEFLGGLLFSQLNMASIYQKHKNPFMDQFILKRRSRFGDTMYRSKGISGSLIKSIRNGAPFYYLPDQDPGKEKGIFASFYGIQTATFPSLTRIAGITRAKVIPCMARIKRFGAGIEVIFHPPLENYPCGDVIEDANTMNRAIEDLIANAPAQYFWSHKRFKTRPDGEESFY